MMPTLSLDPERWLALTQALSLEAQAVLLRMALVEAATGRRVPYDDSTASLLVGVRGKAFRRLVIELVGAGRLRMSAPDGWTIAVPGEAAAVRNGELTENTQ